MRRAFRKMTLAALAVLYVQAEPEQGKHPPRGKSKWAQPQNRCKDNSQQELFHRLRHIGEQGPFVLQDDEALLLFALARVNGISRVLEMGGQDGFSARNFLEAVACTSRPAVYSIDIDPAAPRVGLKHHPIHKWPGHLTAADLDWQTVDLILLDGHHYPATIEMLRRVLTQGLLAPEGLIALHDTGLHPPPPGCTEPPHSCEDTREHTALVSLNESHLPTAWQQKSGWMHQPVERLVAQWLTKFDCNAEWQVLVAHDDRHRRGASTVRHGLTIMQRRVSLHVPQHVCDAGKFGRGGVGPETPAECREVQAPSGKCDVAASTAAAPPTVIRRTVEPARRHQQTAVTDQMGAAGQSLHLSFSSSATSKLGVVMVAWGGLWICWLRSYYTK
jgi:predicted O-methyltransferase YrrM